VKYLNVAISITAVIYRHNDIRSCSMKLKGVRSKFSWPSLRNSSGGSEEYHEQILVLIIDLPAEN
jgi:hypothetical protein